MRRLWREPPEALGQPPAWLLATALRELDRLPERAWPADAAAWQLQLAEAGARNTA
ncbi:MAG: hypothetical protein ACKODB_15120 [Betaproteobacteria bacterium]